MYKQKKKEKRSVVNSPLLVEDYNSVTITFSLLREILKVS